MRKKSSHFYVYSMSAVRSMYEIVVDVASALESHENIFYFDLIIWYNAHEHTAESYGYCVRSKVVCSNGSAQAGQIDERRYSYSICRAFGCDVSSGEAIYFRNAYRLSLCESVEWSYRKTVYRRRPKSKEGGFTTHNEIEREIILSFFLFALSFHTPSMSPWLFYFWGPISFSLSQN